MRTTASFRATPFTGRDAGNGVGNGGVGMAGYGSGSGSYSYSPGQIGDGNGGTFSRNSDLSGYLDAWRQAANEQAQKRIDYAVNKGVNDLQRAEEDAKVQFQTQRNQVDADEARNLDNAALYAELRGDRGGIGQQQYSSVQNNAAQNRQTVNSAQVKLATDTQRQIADLRAQGEFQKADKLLEISQSYLQQLVSLEQWAAEYDLSAAQFNESVRQWEKEYQLSVANLMGTYNGQQTLSARNAQASDLASAGKALLSAGILPSSEQAEAMGYTIPQLQLMLAQNQAGQSAGASGGGAYSSGASGSSRVDSGFGKGIGQLAIQNTKKLMTQYLNRADLAGAIRIFSEIASRPSVSESEYNELVKVFERNGFSVPLSGEA